LGWFYEDIGLVFQLASGNTAVCKRLSYSNENSTCTTAFLKRSISWLRNLLRIYLRNHCEEQHLSTIVLMILYCDVKVHYEKLVWDLRSKQRRQLFIVKGCFRNTTLEWCFFQTIATTISEARCHGFQYDKFVVKM